MTGALERHIGPSLLTACRAGPTIGVVLRGGARCLTRATGIAPSPGILALGTAFVLPALAGVPESPEPGALAPASGGMA